MVQGADYYDLDYVEDPLPPRAAFAEDRIVLTTGDINDSSFSPTGQASEYIAAFVCDFK